MHRNDTQFLRVKKRTGRIVTITSSTSADTWPQLLDGTVTLVEKYSSEACLGQAVTRPRHVFTFGQPRKNRPTVFIESSPKPTAPLHLSINVTVPSQLYFCNPRIDRTNVAFPAPLLGDECGLDPICMIYTAPRPRRLHPRYELTVNRIGTWVGDRRILSEIRRAHADNLEAYGARQICAALRVRENLGSPEQS